MRERRWLARRDLYSLGVARWFFSFFSLSFFFFSRNKSSENKSAVLKIQGKEFIIILILSGGRNSSNIIYTI